MYVEISVTGNGHLHGELRGAMDLKRFHVRVGAHCSDEAVAHWLLESGAGHRAGENVAINVNWLRQCTADRAPDWQEGFQRMLDYAATEGWMDDSRTVVMAHVEDG